MLIRSQDKKSLVKVGDLVIVEHVKDCEIWCNHINFEDVLGTYSTKEKAIKVLDMIQEKYIAYSGKFKDKYNYAVFQMPQDDEVEV